MLQISKTFRFGLPRCLQHDMYISNTFVALQLFYCFFIKYFLYCKHIEKKEVKMQESTLKDYAEKVGT